MTESTLIPIRSVCIGVCGYAGSSILVCKKKSNTKPDHMFTAGNSVRLYSVRYKALSFSSPTAGGKMMPQKRTITSDILQGSLLPTLFLSQMQLFKF